MELLFGVSDFGKIKHAEVVLGDFTLFVGDNNSGKPFMMQLLYGVLIELGNVEPTVNGIETQGENELVYGAEWLKDMETRANDYLSEKRAHIYAADVKGHKQRRRSGILFHYHPDRRTLRRVLASQIWRMISFLGKSVRGVNGDLLFLPASRTGLQLLSKYFFAERDRKAVSEISILDFGDEDDKVNQEVTENELGLTMPVYDFLQFLLRYNQRAEMDRRNGGLLEFIERHLIDGQVKHLGDEIYYRPDALQDDRKDIPVYLASSLVNEITPIIKALSGRFNYRYIFYDEVETCLHPLKQGEMARLIIRLVNSGKRMIVSTHSDTMACKLNNLLLLSFSEDSEEIREKKLNELGLSEEDLLSDAKVHVYQFVNQKDGSSHVEELKFQRMPYIGYDFNLFTRNLDELYHETDKKVCFRCAGKDMSFTFDVRISGKRDKEEYHYRLICNHIL
ncbi:MAG: ATP-binding protein [Lachnospiraceae bacterium]|nr:ATP-binding protein [Lachnospiraceae bacterium]